MHKMFTIVLGAGGYCWNGRKMPMGGKVLM